MTYQNRLSKLAVLDAALQAAKDSLSKEDYAAFQTCLPAMERFLSYVPSPVRRAVCTVILARLDVHELPGGAPDHLRRQLLLAILKNGPQDVHANFALKVMFRDTSLSEWANEHDIAYMTWTKPTNDNSYVEFIKFERAYHE